MIKDHNEMTDDWETVSGFSQQMKWWTSLHLQSSPPPLLLMRRIFFFPSLDASCNADDEGEKLHCEIQ